MRTVVVLLLGVMLCVGSAWGQGRVEVYPDDRMMWSDILMHVEQGVVRTGQDWRGDVIFTTVPGKIFSGYSTSTFDLIYSIRDNQLIQGDSYFSDAILYTWDNMKLYIGDSTFPLDLVYTIRPHPFNDGVFGLFKEDSISTFDRICVFQGVPTTTEIFALLLAQGLL